jgi:mRNA interferase RelE/StbE
MPDKISKFIASLDKKTKDRLKAKLIQLKQDPFSNLQDVKKLHGCSNVYRLRMGKIRIIFSIIDKDIQISDIDYRGNIY